jgi:hypothetical protein
MHPNLYQIAKIGLGQSLVDRFGSRGLYVLPTCRNGVARVHKTMR